MESLEKAVIQRQTETIGQLTTTVIELDIKLQQAIATIQALEKEKELEGLKNGDNQQSEPNAAGRKESNAKRV